MTNHLASADSLSSYTWDRLMTDLREAGMFESHVSECISVTGNAGEERRRYHGARALKSTVEAYAEDSRAHFALLVRTLRQNPYGIITPNDILDRPRHWLVAYAIAEKLAGRA